MAEAPESKEFREHIKVLTGAHGGIMSCSNCGMDIEIGQTYRNENGTRHDPICPKRRR